MQGPNGPMFPATPNGARAHLDHCRKVLGDKIVDAILQAGPKARPEKLAAKYGIRPTSVIEIWWSQDDIDKSEADPNSGNAGIEP
jgi:hypothetical protein